MNRTRTRTALAFTIAALLAGVSLVPQAAAAQLEPDAPEVAGDLARSLRAWRTQSLDLPLGPAEQLEVVVLVDGQERVLELSRFSLRSDDFRLLVETRPGVYEEASAPEPRTYRGRVRGLAPDTVAATLVDGRLWASIDLGDHLGRWYVQPQSELTARDVGNRHVAYKAADAIPTGSGCGNGAGEPLLSLRAASHLPALPTAASPPALQEAQLAIDTDHELYLYNGSRLDSTVYDVEALMNAVDLVYRQQAGICYEINLIVVRPNGDPYAPITADTTLAQFRQQLKDEWVQNHPVSAVPRDIVHLLSGQSQTGTIGRAFHFVPGVVCDEEWAYGLSLTHAPFLLQERISLTAHELGHNWSACHCDQDCSHADAPGGCATSAFCGLVSPACGIMCSTIGGCSGAALTFSAPSLGSIEEHRVGLQGVAGCLEPCLDGGDLGTASAIPADFGDAWVGNTGDNVLAYPGVLSRFPSFYGHRTAVIFQHQHDHGTWLRANAIHDVAEHTAAGHVLSDLPDFLTFRLGEVSPESAFDSRQDPGAPSNDGNPLIVVEALGPNPLATLLVYVSATFDHAPGQTLYLNVLLDQNTDGAFDDGYDYVLNTQLFAWNREHWIKDLAFTASPGLGKELAISGLRLERPTQSHWIRLIVSDAPLGQMFSPADFWDGTMPSTHFVFGEVEDFRLDYYSDASQLPTNGSRFGPGIVLREEIENNPPPGQTKPACFLTLKKINYAAPFGVHQPFVAYVDECPIQTAIGLSFGSVSILGGCDPPAQALIGLYGPTHRQGVMVPPTLVRAPGAAFPGGNMAAAMACPPVVALAANHPDNGAALWDNGVIPVQALRDGVKNWHVCYPCGPAGPPCRFRRYSFLVDVKTCGSEIQNVVYFDQSPQEGDLDFGHLIERFEDPLENPPRLFPDPDFTNYVTLLADPFSIAGLTSVEHYSLPNSFRLLTATYLVEPTLPNDDVRAVQFGFRHLCEIQEVQLTSTLGQTVSFFPPIDCLQWQTFSYDLPPGFDLQTIAITGGDAYIDDVWLRLAPIEDFQDCNANGGEDADDIASGTSTDDNLNGVPDECEFDDCNDNGTPDADDLSSGSSADCNANALPDECETDCDGNGQPDDCDVAGGAAPDCNGNGRPDACDTAYRSSPDADGNGSPDECQDGDTDGTSLTADCDDGNDQVWSTPGEVRDLRWLDGVTLAWTAPVEPGGVVVEYDTLQAPAPYGFLFSATCVESDDGADELATDGSTPAAGGVAYYLVRAENGCPAGAGSVGSDSFGVLRLAGGCP